MKTRRRFAALLQFFIVVALAPTAAGSGDDWSNLRRPFHLPKLRAGASCPVSHVDPRVRQGRDAGGRGAFVGRGPVYPGLGQTGGLLLASRMRSGGPWFGQKVLWYIVRDYAGPALIRGRRLDGPQLVRFGYGGLPAAELQIARGQTTAWRGQPLGSRGVPSTVRLSAPGCYAFQIDGTTFSRIVVFVGDLAY